MDTDKLLQQPWRLKFCFIALQDMCDVSSFETQSRKQTV